MRLANDIAAAAMDHRKLVIEAGMTEAEIAAEWEGFVHGEGTGWEEGRPCAGLLARSGQGPTSDLHGDDVPPRRRARADAVRDLGLRRRLLVRPHEEPRGRRAHTVYRELEQGLMAVYEDVLIDFAQPGASLPSSTGASGKASMRSDSRVNPHTRSVTASVLALYEQPYAHQAEGEITSGMVLQSNQDAI